MSDLINNGGPAFPRSAVANDYGIAYGEQDGMSLRDWFAGQALAGLAHDVSVRQAGEIAYQYADAMLRARKGGAA